MQFQDKVSGSGGNAEGSIWNIALESSIDVRSKILHEDLRLFSMLAKTQEGKKLAAPAWFLSFVLFYFLFGGECVPAQCLRSSEPHLLLLAATAAFATQTKSDIWKDNKPRLCRHFTTAGHH